MVAAPSRGEGFGLPVLEAMACGAPVLTTYRTSLPEVGGNAVAYTEPDAESIAAALRALLDDPERRPPSAKPGTPGPGSSPGRRRRPRTLASYKRAAESRSSVARGRVGPAAFEGDAEYAA